jgi:hypothetical protein
MLIGTPGSPHVGPSGLPASGAISEHYNPLFANEFDRPKMPGAVCWGGKDFARSRWEVLDEGGAKCVEIEDGNDGTATTGQAEAIGCPIWEDDV